jgi:hypothetical protein
MRFACWITKAPNTHSGYVILIVFPRQQWLRERAYVTLYVHCLCCMRFQASTPSSIHIMLFWAIISCSLVSTVPPTVQMEAGFPSQMLIATNQNTGCTDLNTICIQFYSPCSGTGSASYSVCTGALNPGVNRSGRRTSCRVKNV